MKKIASIAAVMLMAVVFVLAGCNSTPTPENSSTPATTSSTASGTNSTEPQTDDSLQKVLDKGELILGLDDSLPPMGYRDDNNNIVGFDIDLATEVCKRMGVKLTPKPINWKSNVMELNARNIDCVWNGMSVNPEREAAMNLSDPYMQNRMVLLVMKDSAYTDQASLAGKKIGVQNGSNAQTDLEGTDFYKTIGSTVGFDDNVMACMNLETGNVDAVFLDETVANYYLSQGKAYRILEDELTPKENYAIGFRKNDQALRDKVQETLNEMKADGKLAEISNQWFGRDVTDIK